MSHICEYRKFKTWWHPSSNVKIESYICDICGRIKSVNVPLDLDTYTSTATRTHNVSFVEAGKEKLHKEEIKSVAHKHTDKPVVKVEKHIVTKLPEVDEEFLRKIDKAQEKEEREMYRLDNECSKPVKISIWQKIKKFIFR